jgi:hypothetical protein
MANQFNLENEVKTRNTNKYKLVQLPEHVHTILKAYCNEKGFIMSSFVSALIKQAVKAKNK